MSRKLEAGSQITLRFLLPTKHWLRSLISAFYHMKDPVTGGSESYSITACFFFFFFFFWMWTILKSLSNLLLYCFFKNFILECS